MAEKILVRTNPDSDDFQDVIVGGEKIAELSYDAGGWAGMHEARQVLKALAKRLGLEYQEEL